MKYLKKYESMSTNDFNILREEINDIFISLYDDNFISYSGWSIDIKRPGYRDLNSYRLKSMSPDILIEISKKDEFRISDMYYYIQTLRDYLKINYKVYSIYIIDGIEYEFGYNPIDNGSLKTKSNTIIYPKDKLYLYYRLEKL